ncbi:hypothetical protein J2Y58_003914 [Sphingomonas sp. BE138]|uniref:TonB-dependent receptor n=1 Tax=Sphingomonas sp. BE138 TaxID=2817845 RepID=UPI0028571006|nr:TonB-dependent receptor [Sphingomonas sp. BE138]MDR6790531.1 hypothetical protein [Sphingomonas sp. BE138]
MRALLAAVALVQAPAQDAPGARTDGDVVVTGERRRGSVLGEVPPLAVLDADAIRALGAATMQEVLARLKGVTTSASGDPPVLLLNGRRVSGWEELRGIPPEAIERTEVLPETEAARFGFAPTVRIMNFITKQHFRAVATLQLAGVTTEGGGSGTDYSEANATRIEGDRRTSLLVSYFRQNAITQADRGILPDPVTPFATLGNVAGLAGASLDTRLDALAGAAVTRAAVPGDPTARTQLGAYLAGANRFAITDTGRFRTLQPQNDRVQVDATIALPLTQRIGGSLNLTMEAGRHVGLNGLADGALRVPVNSGWLPFDTPVTLYRYFPEAVLRQRSTELKLHGRATLNGAIGRWSWNATAAYDRVRSAARAEQGVPLDDVQRAIDAGGDPFAARDPATRLASRSVTRTATANVKLVANGALLRVPAGAVQMTVNADYARAASRGAQPGAGGAAGEEALDLTRTVRAVGVNVAVPIAAAAQGVLPMLGQLGVNGTAGIADVSGVGRLASVSYGANWAPVRPLELAASVDDTRTAPDILALTAATLVTPNVPLFDFATGRDAVVTVTSGGNPALAPARRRITRVSAGLHPLRRTQLDVTLAYVAIAERGRSVAPGTTALLQAAFPDRFVRDGTGRLVQADLRAVNIALEDKRKLQLSANLSLPLGASPPAATKEAGAPRATLFTSLTGSWRLADRARPRAGGAAIDLLDGGTLDGRGGRARWEVEGTVGVSKGAVTLNSYWEVQGPTRVRDPLPASDLRFSGRTWIVLDARADVGQLVPRGWTRQMTINLTVENLLNDRIDVRDATGAVPNRFQPAYLDPVGRSVRLGVRKLF